MISLNEVIVSHVDNLKNTFHTSIPATIVSLNTVGDRIDTVNVRPVVDKVFEDGDVMDAHVIDNVPLCFPSSNKGILSFPVKEGDDVLLICCHSDIQRWLKGDSVREPQSLRKFSLVDAVAIPSIRPKTQKVKPNKDDVELSFNEFKLTVSDSGKTSLVTNGEVSTTTNLSVTFDSDAFNVNSSSTKVNSSSVFIGNSFVDLVGYLSELTDKISQLKTADGIPLDPTDILDLQLLKAKIDTLK